MERYPRTQIMHGRVVSPVAYDVDEGRGVRYKLLGVLALAFSMAACSANSPREGWIAVGSVESVRQAGVVYLDDLRVFVVGDRPRLFALDAVVLPGYPDLVSRVLYCPPSGWFFGPHGVYDHTGKARFGPAKYGMDRVAIAVADGIVYVNPKASTRGPLRRMNQDNSDANVKAFCDEWGTQMNPEGPPGFVRRSFWRST